MATLMVLSGARDEPPSGEPVDLHDRLQSVIAESELPGLAVAVTTSDQLLAIGVAGVRERGTEEPIARGDLFHIGSCTKSMTATLVAMLVAEGALSFDLRLAEAFPEDAASMRGAYGEVTLRQVLNHRAGLHPFTSDNEKYWSETEQEGKPAEQRRKFVRALLTLPPINRPGTALVYSNAGYGLAGCVAEQAMQEPWEDLLVQYLFEPLEMASAGFGWPATAGRPDQPRGHLGTKVFPVDDEYQLPAAIDPAGEVHCSVEDLARYAAFHLRCLRGTSELLDPESAAILYQPPDAEVGYAAGWIVVQPEGERMLWHNGSAGPFYALIQLYPERDRAIVGATNTSAAAEAAFVALFRALADEFRPRQGPGGR